MARVAGLAKSWDQQLHPDKRRRVNFSQRGIPAEAQSQIQIGQKVQDHLADALFAGDGQSPYVRTADQDRPCAQGDRLHDVGPAADAAVEQHRDPTGDPFSHSR